MSLQERSSELNYAEPGASISATSSASDEEFQVLPLGYSIDNPHPGELDIHKELANLNNTTATLINSPHSKVVGCDLHIVVGDHANVYLGDCNHSKPNPDNPLPFTNVPRLSCVNGGPSDRQRRSNSAIVKQTTPIHRSKAELMPMIFIGSILITIIGVVVWSETKATNKSFPTASPITPYSPYTTDTPDYDGFYIPRYLWGAMDPKSSPIEARPALLMVIKHTAGKTCSDQTQCRARVRDIQKVHVLTQNYSDITYNFLIGGDGKIYNGRGWGVRNEDRNDSLDVAFIGNFNYNDPTTTMMNAASRIQIDAQLRGWVDYENYRVLNHNQTEPTDSPGSLLFSKVSLLSHYSPALCYHNSTEQVVIDYDCPYNN